MQNKAPMFISKNGRTIRVPNNRDGKVEMNRGEVIYLACPGVTNNVDGYTDKIVKATCSSGKLFRINNEAQLTSIGIVRCRQFPMSYTNVIGDCANYQGKLIEIGFQFNTNNIPQMHVCFDLNQKRIYWTKASVSGLSPVICPVGNISFSSEYFDRINPDDRYRQQHRRLTSEYIIDGNPLEKGHLVAKCDFSDAARQRMTSHYINTAPRWKSFNGGNWRNLETIVRQEALERNIRLGVYTGTHDTLLTSTSRAITLDSSGKMPVPLYFWKVVIEKQAGEGIAFLGVNDPINLYPSLCPDICNQITWLGNFNQLRKRKNNGIVYCCSIENLKKIPNIVLPVFQEYTGGILD